MNDVGRLQQDVQALRQQLHSAIEDTRHAAARVRQHTSLLAVLCLTHHVYCQAARLELEVRQARAERTQARHQLAAAMAGGGGAATGGDVVVGGTDTGPWVPPWAAAHQSGTSSLSEKLKHQVGAIRVV